MRWAFPYKPASKLSGTPLNVLLVEDCEDDAELILIALRRGGYEPRWERVDTAPAMATALARQRWDVVLADCVMPHFSGVAAVQLAHEQGGGVPIIVVSGESSAEIIAAVRAAGARDYVTKNNLAQLVPAIKQVVARRPAPVPPLAKRSLLLTVAMAAGFTALVGCGSAGGEACDGEPVMDRFADRARAVEACLGLTGSEHLAVRFEPTMACPESGRLCCLAADAPAPCSEDSAEVCGSAGRFRPSCQLIRLPDACDDALEHELVHGLRYVNGMANWKEHDQKLVVCQLAGSPD
jgi:CheY-like chemotaxis protein